MHKRGVVQYTKSMSELHRYSSIKEAEAVYSISHISGVCRRRRKSDGGYVWRYEDDVDPMSDHFVTSNARGRKRGYDPCRKPDERASDAI